MSAFAPLLRHIGHRAALTRNAAIYEEMPYFSPSSL
jgi:hypothetical protein